MRNSSLWSEVVFRERSNFPWNWFLWGIAIKHMKAHNFVFQYLTNFHRVVIVCICWDTASEKTSLWQLIYQQYPESLSQHLKNNWSVVLIRFKLELYTSNCANSLHRYPILSMEINDTLSWFMKPLLFAYYNVFDRNCLFVGYLFVALNFDRR